MGVWTLSLCAVAQLVEPRAHLLLATGPDAVWDRFALVGDFAIKCIVRQLYVVERLWHLIYCIMNHYGFVGRYFFE